MALSYIDLRTPKDGRKLGLLESWEYCLELGSEGGTFKQPDALGDVDIVERTEKGCIAVIGGCSENDMFTVNIVNIQV